MEDDFPSDNHHFFYHFLRGRYHHVFRRFTVPPAQIIMPIVAKVKIIITCGLEYCPGALRLGR